MRFALLPVASFLFFAFSLTVSTANAQTFAANGHFAAPNKLASLPTGPVSNEPKEMVVLTGRITNPAGALPGAVVILKGTKEMAVTNANGEFHFVVPANSGALQAVVTYAGYADEEMTLNAAADESTLSLTNARVIVVSRKQQLKKYLKTANKQVKRDLRKARS